MGDCAYVVESGALEVALGDGMGRQVLAQVGAGAVLGELALVDGRPRSASVIAMAPTVLRIITREYLNMRMDDADPMLRHIMHLLADRFRDVVTRLADRSGEPAAPGRGATTDADAADRVQALSELELQQALENALEKQEFELHYQPIVRLKDRSVAGFEALIRWPHPERGMILPSAFIPAAERSGLIAPMGRWIVRTAAASLAQLDARQRASAPGRPALFMSVNLSVRQLGDTQLIASLAAAIQRHAIAPERLRLEITESALFDNLEAASDFLEQCRAVGVELLVDDFGRGHSSLSYLYRLPISGIKVDQSYIGDLVDYPASSKVVGAVAKLAESLSLDAVAEGIETAEQCAVTRNLGLKFGQGYYFAPALSLAQAERFLQGSNRSGSWDPPGDAQSMARA